MKNCRLFFCCLSTVAMVEMVWTGNALAQCTGDADCGSEMECEDGNCATAKEGPLAAAVATGDAANPGAANVEKERIKPLWISGLATFGVVYVATIVGNAALSDPDARGPAVGYALIPMAGPFISLGNDSDETDVKSEFTGIMVVSGVLQILGVAAFTAGMIIKREPKEKQVSRGPRFWLTPTPIGTHGAGAVFTLTHF